MMYSPLNEEFMFQEIRNRKEEMTRPRRQDIAARAGRRWWRRTQPPARRAG